MYFAKAALIVLFAFGSFGASPTQAASVADDQPQATIYLASGRSFAAAIDERTDQQTLWLRFDGTTAVLYRPIEWDHVTAIEYDGQRHQNEQMVVLATQLKNGRQVAEAASRNSVAAHEPSLSPTAVGGTADANNVEQLPTATYAEVAEEILALTPRVQAINIDAYVANWDADVELDGVVLLVTTIDPFGHSVPASGTVRAELRVERRSRLKPQPRRIRADFERIGSWTRQLPIHSGGESVFLLPFEAVHPEFDEASASHGLLNVRVTVPGQGVFERSIADLTVRPYSRIREQIQHTRDTRFLPIEQTGRGK
ncbi:MAG TPA: hypothetical protein VMX74_07150 [Pirellulales bacterium]|nr:hypothetical protein [Pirellulales bacterium]